MRECEHKLQKWWVTELWMAENTYSLFIFTVFWLLTMEIQWLKDENLQLDYKFHMKIIKSKKKTKTAIYFSTNPSVWCENEEKQCYNWMWKERKNLTTVQYITLGWLVKKLHRQEPYQLQTYIARYLSRNKSHTPVTQCPQEHSPIKEVIVWYVQLPSLSF